MKTNFGMFFIMSIIILVFKIRNAHCEQPYSEDCPSPSDCPIGLDSNQTLANSTCNSILLLIYAARSGCVPYFGKAVDLTDAAFASIGAFTTNNNVCDYFEPNSMGDDCLNPYGTLEINFCLNLLVIAHAYRNICSYLYTFNTCELTYLGQEAINYAYSDPDNKPCAATPYIPSCSQESNPGSPALCPACIVSPCS